MSELWHEFPWDNLEEAVAFGRRFYALLGVLHPPALHGEPVHFTRIGIDHLLFKKSRTKEDKILRIWFLQYVQDILLSKDAALSLMQRLDTIYVKRDGRHTSLTASVQYWSFTKQVSDSLILRVVVRQIEQGPKHFYSIMKRQ